MAEPKLNYRMPPPGPGELFHVEVRKGIYLIADDSRVPTEDGRSVAPGDPTGNSYLVIGAEKALLFDLAVDHPDIRAYAEKLAKKPMMLAVSHGHGDHTYRLSSFDEVWIHPADEPLLQGNGRHPAIDPCPKVRHLLGGDAIDLGGRVLDVIHIPGHTDGSILLYDRETRTLLGGDTFARRILYGTATFRPLQDFCRDMEKLKDLNFDVAYSAHDRCALPAAYLDFILRLMREELPKSEEVFHFMPREMLWLLHGDPYTLDFFDITFPLDKKDTLFDE